MADILGTLASATPTDLRPLQIRLKFVGTQKKSVPAVAFTTFHHLLVPEWFTELGTSGGRDDSDWTGLWNFTVTPEEMTQVARALAASDLFSETRERRDPCLSVTVAVKGSRIGTLGFEAVLDRDRCAVLMDALSRVFDSNPLARQVIAQHRQLTCP